MSLDDFCRLTPDEFYECSKACHDQFEMLQQAEWERMRMLATITIQNYFRMYKKLSGMTGTAKTEETEFQGIYALDGGEIPTNKPNIRDDLEDMVYKNKNAKYPTTDIIRKIILGNRSMVSSCIYSRDAVILFIKKIMKI